jgi:Na+/glutamate symporter
VWGGVAAGAALGVAGGKIIDVWTDGNIAVDWPLYLLLLVAAVANSLWYTALMVPYATNRHARIAMAYCLVYGLAAFAFAYAGSKTLGLAGVGAALLLTEIAMAAYVLPIAWRLSDERGHTWFVKVAQPPWFLLGWFRQRPEPPEKSD